MIVVTTPTGQIGASLLSRLIEANVEVRVIARDPSKLPTDVRERVDVVEGSHRHLPVMSAALDGADALFLVVPPGFEDGGAHFRYLDFAHNAMAAVTKHEVPRVVGVTSAGHDWTGKAGLLSAAFAMDAAIRESGVAYRALSMPWFMENLLNQAGQIRESGRLSMGYTADRALPSIAAQDVAAVAAGLLLDLTWTSQENVPVFGPDQHTPVQMAEVISQVLGRPVEYVQVELEAIAARFIGRGSPQIVADDMTQMIGAQNSGIYDVDVATTSPTQTSFQTWVETVFKPAFDTAA
jgi:uncharacterized protein YbjT (DUF2867 family)